MKKNIIKIVVNYFLMAAIIFAIQVVAFSVISDEVSKVPNMPYDIIIYGVASLITSAILVGILQINKLSAVLQVIIVYVCLSIIFLVVGYLIYVFDFRLNRNLLIITSLCLIIGLLLIILIYQIKVRRANNSLNKRLKEFKERDR